MLRVTVAMLPSYQDLLARTDAPAGTSWGVFGADDHIGTLNLLTPERRRAAPRLVRRGDTINLDLPLDLPAVPFFPHRRAPIHTFLKRREGNSRDDFLDGFAPQYSSQWDSLRHMRNPTHGFYNGTLDNQVETEEGSLGMEHLSRHGIVGRGVLLDVVRYLAAQGDTLEPDVRRELPASLLDEVADDQGVRLETGDVVLFRTGVGAMVHADAARVRASGGPPPEREYQGPGLSPEQDTLAWLWDHHVAAIVSDNLAIEAWPPTSEQRFLHFTALPLLGVIFGELFDLEALADDCARDGVYEFLFVAKPLMLRGGVGSPANAMALK